MYPDRTPVKLERLPVYPQADPLKFPFIVPDTQLLPVIPVKLSTVKDSGISYKYKTVIQFMGKQRNPRQKTTPKSHRHLQ